MPILIATLRWFHIVSGFTAFFIAPVALISAKGGPTHRRWGKVYFYCMAAVAVTALLLALYRPNYFLAFTSVFTFYMAFSGYRVLILRRRTQTRGPRPLDWFAALMTLACSLALIALGVFRFTPIAALAPVAIAFGSFGSLISATHIFFFLNPPRDPKMWLFGHFSGMLGSYIAAVTAFSVLNFHFLPVAARWLWPSAVGIPLIFVWRAYYASKPLQA